MPYWIFHFFLLHFALEKFRFVSFRSVSFRFVWFSFRFVRFRFVSLRSVFISFRTLQVPVSLSSCKRVRIVLGYLHFLVLYPTLKENLSCSLSCKWMSNIVSKVSIDWNICYRVLSHLFCGVRQSFVFCVVFWGSLFSV